MFAIINFLECKIPKHISDYYEYFPQSTYKIAWPRFFSNNRCSELNGPLNGS